ncbi:MAG: hypothetical protein AAGF11_02900 [Myxococcota bacterium]
MSSSTIRLEKVGAPSVALVAMVELDRRAGVRWHSRFGRVELVDHVSAWVFEDGMVLAAVTRRSALSLGQVLGSRVLRPAPQAALNEVERADVLHAAGLRSVPSQACEPVRWEVA